MIELPEAVTLAGQMTKCLQGKRIASALRGNAPHKFTWYNREPEEYAAILRGKTLGSTEALGGMLNLAVDPGYVLQLGGGGERIFLHADGARLPKRHQLLLEFDDGGFLSVTVQMWGSAVLFDREEADQRSAEAAGLVSPLTDAFTWERFRGLFAELEPEDKRSVKYFAISSPGVWGMGNGYLHDVLFRSRLHPRRPAVSLSECEQRAFFDALVTTLRDATALGGRDTELDLHGQPGGYRPILDRRAKANPCPECASPIQAIAYLGGTSYFCPTCQV